jgi:peptide/nickel transport system ATP-binding protein/oligopeptide transport system ATP-binding protein
MESKMSTPPVSSASDRPGPLLDVRNLRMHISTYEGVVKAVDGIDLQVGPGEIVGLVGESGSGKSMTSRTIVGLLPPGGKVLDGEIAFKGRDLLTLPEPEMRAVRGGEIAFIFQNPSTYMNPVLRIGDQIAETVMLHQGLGRRAANQVAIDSLKKVGLRSPDLLCRNYPHQLSGGMLQRVMIAMALSCKPDLLIADECTTDLDVTTQLQVLELLKESVAASGSSLLLITHNLGVVAHMCARVYVMYGGRVAEVANLFDIFEHPRHPYTAGLLKSTLSADSTRSKLVSIKGSVADLIDPPPGCRFHPRCPEAIDACRRREPAMIRISEDQRAACLLCEQDVTA